MESAVAALGALAHEARLGVFRLLVRSGPLSAGQLAEQMAMPASSLSFHLRALAQAGLIESTRSGTTLHYRTCADRLKELLWFIGEDCCQGRTELSLTERIEKRKSTDGAVLFVCSRNSARSQMAEAILRQHDPSIEVCSGGLRPSEIDPLTLQVLEEAGLPTDGLYAKDLGSLLGKVDVATAIVVCEAANEDCPHIHSFAPEQLYWPFEDPVGQEIEVFRRVRDEITKRIRSWK
ncbi:MAG: metalloregulator ArsR/SmtB family transcription factor [Planctomycetota bacterium]|jgi:protein-tyrosine-phosphatase/predicted transcriptional regulator